MGHYIARRLGHMVIVLLGVSILAFGLTALIPGDPALVMLGMYASKESLEAVQGTYGLDKPLPIRYMLWLNQIIRGNMGTSFSSGMSVADVIKRSLSSSLILALTAITLATLIAIPFGVISALNHGKLLDWVSTGVTIVGLSIPEFWFGVLLVMVFSVRLQLLPPSGYVSLLQTPALSLKHLILPTVTVAWRLSASLVRFVRANMIEIMHQQYITTARAKGISPSLVIWKHGLRNALTSVITVVGMQFGTMFGGLIVVEEVFAWPGLGRLAVQAIGFRDYSLLQGIILVFAIVFSLLNLVVDLCYGVLDPRIRYE